MVLENCIETNVNKYTNMNMMNKSSLSPAEGFEPFALMQSKIYVCIHGKISSGLLFPCLQCVRD